MFIKGLVIFPKRPVSKVTCEFAYLLHRVDLFGNNQQNNGIKLQDNLLVVIL